MSGSYIKFPDRSSQPPAPQPAKKPKLTRQRRKRMDEDAVYNAIRDVYLEQNPLCMYCGFMASAEVHHICRGKDRRRSLLNPETWLGLCRSCHDFVEKFSWEIQVCIKQNAVRTTIERLRK